MFVRDNSHNTEEVELLDLFVMLEALFQCCVDTLPYKQSLSRPVIFPLGHSYSTELVVQDELLRLRVSAGYDESALTIIITPDYSDNESRCEFDFSTSRFRIQMSDKHRTDLAVLSIVDHKGTRKISRNVGLTWGEEEYFQNMLTHDFLHPLDVIQETNAVYKNFSSLPKGQSCKVTFIAGELFSNPKLYNELLRKLRISTELFK